MLLHQFQVLSLNFSIICGASMSLCSAVFHVFAIAKPRAVNTRRRAAGLRRLVLAMGIAGWEWMRLLWPLWIFAPPLAG